MELTVDEIHDTCDWSEIKEELADSPNKDVTTFRVMGNRNENCVNTELENQFKAEIKQEPEDVKCESTETAISDAEDEVQEDSESSHRRDSDYLLTDTEEESPEKADPKDSDWEIDSSQSSDSSEDEMTSGDSDYEPHVKVSKKKTYKKKAKNKNHICSICGKGYESPFQLREHNRIHTGERPYLCSTCGKSYRTSRSLTIHKGRHNKGPDRKTCLVCQKTVNGSRLCMHMKIHSGVKPNICQECGKAFLQKNSLRRHSLVHTGELPFKCTQCGKGFNQHGNLKTHLRTHTNQTPYVCSVCGKGFKHSFTRRNHLAKHSEDDKAKKQ